MCYIVNCTMSTGFHGNPHFRWGLWEIKKKAQVFIRTELSLYLSIALLLLVAWREREDLCKTFHELSHLEWATLIFIAVSVVAAARYLWLLIMRRTISGLRHLIYWEVFGGSTLLINLAWISGLGGDVRKVDLTDWTILVVTLGTTAAACWELLGPKLASSPQEIGFAMTMRDMLKKLDEYCYGPKAGQNFDEFLKQFLGLTGVTLCGGRKPVQAACMLRERDELYVVKSSRENSEPDNLRIPLPNTGKQSGPAGWAFHQFLLVYLPDLERAESWSFTAMEDDSYVVSAAPNLGWVRGKVEDFKSVLSVPLKIYDDQGRTKTIGVLNYSNKRLDPFVSRDLLMAECFAKILEQALTFKQRQDHTAAR
jgi:hypothetical protein